MKISFIIFVFQWPLPEFYQKLLRERAQTANAVVGRRFFELDKQDLQQVDILRGVHLANKMEGLLCVDRSRYYKKHIQNANKGYGCSIEISDRDRTKSRPITAIPVISPKTMKPEASSDMPDLSIRQLILNESANDLQSKLTNYGETKLNASNKRFNEYRVHRPMASFKENTNKHERTNSVRELKGDYQERIMSAPAWMSLEPESNDTQQEAHDDEQSKRKTGWTRTRRAEGSTWKPLIYDKESDIKHSQGCPYTCKGCFKACLASEDYLQKMEDRVHQQKERKMQSRRSQPVSFYSGNRHMKVIKKPYPTENFQAVLGSQRIQDRVKMDLVKQHDLS